MVVSPYENQLGAIGHNHNSMGWNIEKSWKFYVWNHHPETLIFSFYKRGWRYARCDSLGLGMANPVLQMKTSLQLLCLLKLEALHNSFLQPTTFARGKSAKYADDA